MTTTNIEPLTPEWHAWRREHVTGTDIPAILGVSRHKSALEVWGRITGRLDTSFNGNAFTDWGNATEATNREQLAQRYGYEVTDSPGLVIDDDRPWLGCTPDGLVACDERDGVGVWEGKSPTVYTADEWREDGAPLQYQVQTVGNASVMGLRWGVLSALVSPTRADDDILRVRVYDLDAEFRALMLDKLDEFWRCCEKDIEPSAQAQDLDALKALHPQDNGRAIYLAAADAEAWAERRRLKAEIREREAAIKSLDASIVQTLGDAAYGILPTGGVVAYPVTRRTNKAREESVSEFRALRERKSLPAGVEVCDSEVVA